MWYFVIAAVMGFISAACAAIRVFMIDGCVQWALKPIHFDLRTTKGWIWLIINLVANFVIEGLLWPIELIAKIVMLCTASEEDAYDMSI